MQRRDFLGLTLFSAALSSVRASEEPAWDVIIAGAGGAGLAAAVSAAEAGARRIIVFEKAAVVGGHTILASGSVSVAAGSRGDPAADMAAEIVASGGEPALAETLARESAALPVWLAGMGVRWEPRLFRAVGSIAVRNMSTGSMRGGYEYVQALNARARALGVEIRLCEPVRSLLTDAGRVTGVVTAGSDGTERFHRARAVVLATGGFGANVPMRRRWRPELDATYRTTADPTGLLGDGATGDGIDMAEAIGAGLTDMDAMQLIPYNGGRVLDYAGGEIWLNAEGRRFVSEDADFRDIQNAIERQPGRMMWALTDAKSRKGAGIGAKMASGIVKTADSIEELARAMEVSEDVLRGTLERYNRMASEKRDLDFGRTAFTQTIDTPPFYFGIERLGIHMTLGGISVDERARVLRRDGSVIPGLYAAGETAGGIHGRNRLGGNALTSAFIFGRIAGAEAVDNVAQNN